MRLDVGDRVPTFEATCLSSRTITDGDLGAAPTLLAFHRYAACTVCSRHLAPYRVRFRELADRGVPMFAVFHSPVEKLLRYFDPERKESIVTPPVRALGLVAAFGTIHLTYDFPEISIGSLALRVALRELLATTTPTRAFDLVTTRKTYGWRPVQYFRLQAPKRVLQFPQLLPESREVPPPESFPSPREVLERLGGQV